ncbi:MAG: hypothetical protein HQL59_00600 [Magnetococcales bacterium]|nr:hypothetical protein [Magnetococcales bacterium]
MDLMKGTIKVAALLVLLLPQWGQASGGAALPVQEWGFKGIFGKFDEAALKRGAKVAVGVCMNCHSLKYIKFDQMRAFGLPEAEIEAMAKDSGRSRKDRMLSVMDAVSAKETYGIEPPDLSLMTKARKGYEDYAYGILTGYLTDQESADIKKAMEDGKLSETERMEVAHVLHMDPRHEDKLKEAITKLEGGGNFNKYFPGHFLAMPQPMQDGAVEYGDGTKASLEQLSRDVVTFLAWAAEPTAEQRKGMGIGVMIYLLVFTAMLYAVKRRIWAKVH